MRRVAALLLALLISVAFAYEPRGATKEEITTAMRVMGVRPSKCEASAETFVMCADLPPGSDLLDSELRDVATYGLSEWEFTREWRMDDDGYSVALMHGGRNEFMVIGINPRIRYVVYMVRRFR